MPMPAAMPIPAAKVEPAGRLASIPGPTGRQLWWVGSCRSWRVLPCRCVGDHLYSRGHAWQHPPDQVRFGEVERDLDRDALDDLREIPGGVVRRHQADLRAGSRLDAGDLAPDGHVAERIDANDRALAETDVGDLAFGGVGGDEHQVERRYGVDLGVRRQQRAFTHLADTERTVDRRDDARVAESDLSELALRVGLSHLRLRLQELRVQQIELTLVHHHLRRRLFPC